MDKNTKIKNKIKNFREIKLELNAEIGRVNKEIETLQESCYHDHYDSYVNYNGEVIMECIICGKEFVYLFLDGMINEMTDVENVLDKAYPCPFCGDDPFLYRERDDHGEIIYFTLHCGTCETEFSLIDGDNISPDNEKEYLDAVKKLVKKWNKRYE